MKSNLENLKSNFEMKKEENLYELDEQLDFEGETIGEILSVQDGVAIVTSLEKVRGGVRVGELGRRRSLNMRKGLFSSSFYSEQMLMIKCYPIKEHKRFTHSSKGGISRLVGGITNALARPHTPSISAAASSIGRSSVVHSDPNINVVNIQEHLNVLEIIKRSMSTITKGSISRFPTEIRAKDHFLRDETLFRCWEIAHKTPENYTNDDLALLQVFLNYFMEEERANNRYLQVGFEVLFPRKPFSLEDVVTLMPKNFSLIDLFKLNGNEVHQSTIFTIMQCWHLLSQRGFDNNKIESNIIIQTPMKQFDPTVLDSKIFQFVTESKRSTGNTSSDIMLNNHVYDLKFANDNKIPLARNIIMSVQSYNEKAFLIFMREWKQYLYTITDKAPISINQESLNYYKDLYYKVKSLDEQKSLSPLEKITMLNEAIFKSMDDRPTQCLIPIMIPVGEKSVKPDINIEEKLNLPSTKDTKPGIVDREFRSLMINLDQESRNRLYKRTLGVFGSDNLDNSDNQDS
jgi:hypothetical protein